jgi:hypothetical protein
MSGGQGAGAGGGAKLRDGGRLRAGYGTSTWFGVGAPKKTPAEIVAGLNSEIDAGLNNQKLAARLTDPARGL